MVILYGKLAHICAVCKVIDRTVKIQFWTFVNNKNERNRNIKNTHGDLMTSDFPLKG